MKREEDPDREDRIIMEIVVDAYGPEERAMGWYCHLENTLRFPFSARCVKVRSISPLDEGDKVKVIGMADSDDCLREMFVMIRSKREIGQAVPLAQLEPGDDADDETRQAVEDWLYWVDMGYGF